MSKYGAKKVEIDNIIFDSLMEGDYYLYLKEQKKQGLIKDFTLQPKFQLIPSYEKLGKKHRARYYVADFKVVYNDNKEVIIDVKGFVNQTFSFKKALYDSIYPLELKLITYTKIDGWIELDDLKIARKERKKLKAEEDKKKRLAQELRESLYMSELELSKIENIIDSNLELKPRYREYLLRYIKENFSTIANMVMFDTSKISKSYRKNIIKIIEIIKGD